MSFAKSIKLHIYQPFKNKICETIMLDFYYIYRVTTKTRCYINNETVKMTRNYRYIILV